MSPVMSPDWKGLLRSMGLTHAHQQSDEAVRAEEALQAARSASAPPLPPQPPQPLHPPPPPPPPISSQTGLHVLWGGVAPCRFGMQYTDSSANACGPSLLRPAHSLMVAAQIGC